MILKKYSAFLIKNLEKKNSQKSFLYKTVDTKKRADVRLVIVYIYSEIRSFAVNSSFCCEKRMPKISDNDHTSQTFQAN